MRVGVHDLMQPVIEHFTSSSGARVSYEKSGGGPPLVLVHGGFSDHLTNWEFVQPALRERFTVYAIARRGRGGTDATQGHCLEDEAQDVAALIGRVGQPVFLLGHSYGAHCAVAAARLVPGQIRKLVLYEPPWPSSLRSADLVRLEEMAGRQAWDEVAVTFFRDMLMVPAAEVEAVRASELWPSIAADAKASLGDLRALISHTFDPERFRRLEMPVLLQVGSESPRSFYVTDALAAVLPDARIEELPGQAHEGMTTAPAMYAESVMRFLAS